MNRKLIAAFSSAAVFCAVLSAEDRLVITAADVRLEQEKPGEFGQGGGYNLYVRKKKGIESVLLTETTKDPEGKSDNYAYRAASYNAVNGDEIRYLDGKKLESEYAKYSLVDSTAEDDKEFGRCFRIYIPEEMQYGYPWSRNGTVKIDKGTFINIRAFEKKYADYSGAFLDNPFMFDLGKKSEKQVAVLTDDYNPIASRKFDEISDFMIYSKGPETIVDDIMDSLKRINPKEKADVVFVIDTTGSMKDDIAKLRKEWVPRLIEGLKDFGSVRLGLLLYRDYGDVLYNYNNIPVKFFDFTNDVSVFTKNLNGFKIYGNEGGDIPEAVYEGLYGGISFYNWDNTAQKKIILIGDAEPHPVPRGTKKYTKELVTDLAAQKGIIIDAIITPDDRRDKRR